LISHCPPYSSQQIAGKKGKNSRRKEPIKTNVILENQKAKAIGRSRCKVRARDVAFKKLEH